MSLNKAMLIGNVGKDPEVRYANNQTSSGDQTAPRVASFPLATSDRYRDRSGNVHENTEWHNIVAWRGLADTVEKFVRKGTQIYVEGRIRTRSWTDQTGAKRYTTEIVADNIQLLGRRQDNPGAQGGYQPQQPAYQPQQQQQPSYQPQQPEYQPQPQQPEGDLPDKTPSDDLPF